MDDLNKFLSGIALPIALVVYAIYFLVKLRGKPLTKPTVMMGAIFKRRGSGTSSMRAVIFALAGTLGVGNIVGVASAIALGGAGAVFWMWVSAALAMVLKYSEVVLAVLHRRRRGSENYGGAMYYMKDCFEKMRRPKVGSVFSFIFVIFCLMNGLSMGCMIQTNAIAESLQQTVGAPKAAVGAAVAALAVIVFIFNGKRVFDICEKLVPFVSLGYLIISLAVIAISYEKIPGVISQIFSDAFTVRSASAGAFGFLTSEALRYGTVRGLFSNEAGCGTSPIAHATSSTSSPCEQGFLGILEVFIDTVVVCTLTALVILLNWDSASVYAENPILTVFTSFSGALGEWSAVALSAAIFLFAFATVVCWGYYCKECVYFLNGRRRAEMVFYWIYIGFVFIGSFVDLAPVWQVADLAVGVMTLMNLFVLGLMSGEIVLHTKYYFNKK